VEDPALGFYQALVEARIPFEMVHDRLLDPAHIDQFKTLILPNIAALSTAQCDQLRQFLERGGSLIATSETSLYDEWGARRSDFGLSSSFGVSFDGGLEGPMQNSYLNVEKDPATGKFHPLLHGLEDVPRIVNGVTRVKVKSASANSYAPLTLVPSYPDLPMEEVYARVPKTEIPGVYTREIGAGRLVYFPWDIDRTFWEVLNIDHARLLRNAVIWATGEMQPLEVIGRGVLDVSVWMQKSSMTVHLVNLTNPMMMKGPIREIIPAPSQQVRVQVPAGKRVTGVHFLVSGGRPAVRRTGSTMEIAVPSIDLHEVIAIDFAQ
jgi:hypothetical protein